MTLSDVAIFDKGNRTTMFPISSSLVTVEAIVLKRHDHIRLILLLWVILGPENRGMFLNAGTFVYDIICLI